MYATLTKRPLATVDFDATMKGSASSRLQSDNSIGLYELLSQVVQMNNHRVRADV